MKPEVLDGLIKDILKQFNNCSSGVINIITTKHDYTLNPDTDEYSVSREDGILLLETQTGTKFISTDAVTAIGI